MGRRSGGPEGAGSRLSEDDAGDLSEFAANFVGQSLVRRTVRFTALVALAEQGFDPSGSCCNQPFGATVEPALLRLANLRPRLCDIIVQIALRPRPEATVDQSQRMADAGQPGDR